MATVKELLTNLANNTRKFLGTEEELYLEDITQGIDEASAESDFQTELIEEFSTILDRSVAPDNYANGREDGYAEGVKQMDALIDGTITEVNSGATSVPNSFFGGYTKLESANFPNATSIGTYSFQSCSALSNINVPNATSIGKYAFKSCSKLTSVDFPNVTKLDYNTFEQCSALKTANFPNVTIIEDRAFLECRGLLEIICPNVSRITNSSFELCLNLSSIDTKATLIGGSNAFAYCGSLKSVILRSETVCTLASVNAFSGCYHILGTKNSTYNPTGAKDGYFYVPRALVDSYKSATNWATYSTQFRALEDYTVDGTITGALDPNKI